MLGVTTALDISASPSTMAAEVSASPTNGLENRLSLKVTRT